MGSRIKVGRLEDSIASKFSHNILEVIFSYLSLSDLKRCLLVCKHWNRYLCNEDNDVWRMHCIRELGEETMRAALLSSTPTYKSKLRAYYYAWNPLDCSRNVYIKPNGFTMHR